MAPFLLKLLVMQTLVFHSQKMLPASQKVEFECYTVRDHFRRRVPEGVPLVGAATANYNTVQVSCQVKLPGM